MRCCVDRQTPRGLWQLSSLHESRTRAQATPAGMLQDILLKKNDSVEDMNVSGSDQLFVFPLSGQIGNVTGRPLPREGGG